MKRNELNKIVGQVLLMNPKSRDDDFELISNVYYLINKNILGMTFNKVMQEHNELNLPSIESITRVRRKIQSLDPSLCSKAVKERRKKLEKEYRDYYSEFDRIMEGNYE